MICTLGREYSASHPVCRSCVSHGAVVCKGSLRAKANKHGNVKVEVDGILFHSKREAARHLHLMVLLRAGVISDLKLQVPFILSPAVVLDGRKKPNLKYVSDFTYVRDGVLVVEDSKSPHLRKNPVFRMKKHLLAVVHGLQISEV
jgi:Protein of unknown function (DUF1064)